MSQLFANIPDSLKQYGDAVTFILGTASALNADAKAVTISTSEGQKTQEYDILVITTGSRTNDDIPWKGSLSGYEATKDRLHKVQDQVKSATSIVLGGGGPTGVETAGELGFEYGNTKKITLVQFPVVDFMVNTSS